MLLSKREQYEHYMALDSEGYYFARYNHLTLTSVYQPVFNQNLKLVGLEALLRIKNQYKDILRPDLFFSENAIDCLTKKNVEHISREMHIRNFRLMELNHLTLFLNVLPMLSAYSSVKHISEDLLVKRIDELGVGCSEIVLEILEHRTNNDNLKVITNELRQLGFRIAMDDFGRSASDIHRATCLNPHIIKIDKSLLDQYTDGETKNLTDALRIAKKLKAKTVVEGIETESQLLTMQSLGVDMFQGYHLGKPCPAPVFKRLFEPQSFELFNQTMEEDEEHPHSY